MSNIRVSTVEEVLERFRERIVVKLRATGFAVPEEATVRGGCFQAYAAWVRLQHRSITIQPRTVRESLEIQSRQLDSATRGALTAIRADFEQGADVTHRLTRCFYKTGFNDFLFNTFGIQHMHLGAPGAGRDKTKRHAMSGGANDLLFVLLGRQEVHFLDVLDHDIFKGGDDAEISKSAEMSKALVRIALRNWPDVLNRYVIPGVEAEMSFEEAFRVAKSGFTTLFQVDDVCFARGTMFDGKVTNGKRAACTSTEVMRATNASLNMITELVEFITREASTLAKEAESRVGGQFSEFDLEVVLAGRAVVLRDVATGVEFVNDGQRFALRN